MLTLYELIHGDMTSSQGWPLVVSHRLDDPWLTFPLEFHGMDQEILQRSLNILVKRGKAQVFGSEDQQGVKFF